MTDKPKSYTNNNVYILGAGFAKDAGYPLVADFLNRARDSVAWLEGHGRQKEADAVAAVLRFRLDAASAAYRVRVDVEDIEQLFSLASARDDAGAALSDQVKLCIAATLDYARAHQVRPWAHLGMSGGEPAYSKSWQPDTTMAGTEGERRFHIPCYEYYAGMMAGAFTETSGTNTIITLNYDTLVEEALQSMGYAVSYEFGGGRGGKINFDESWTQAQGSANWTVPVLKLHGSVNWARPGRRAGKLRVFGSYDDVRKAGLVPALIPPTWRKDFGDALGGVWAAAVKSIEHATRIFVIGFSIPETDPHFKYLLAAGLQNNISLRELLYMNPAMKTEGAAQVLATRVLGILREELITKQVVKLYPWKTEELFFLTDGMNALARGPDGVFGLRAMGKYAKIPT